MSRNRILKVDLSNRKYEVEEVPVKIMRQYMGGRGLASYILYNTVPARTDPLSEASHIIFAGAPADATGFFYSSKVSLVTKSPLTGVYLSSVSSGIAGHQMAKAGIIAIDITGIAESPTYLLVNNDGVEFKDAKAVWGLETAEAQRLMLGSLSAKEAATIGIGPAGEKLVKYAGVFGEGPLYRCWARGGGGCVMGSKHLKGIVITGNNSVQVKDEARFTAAKETVANNLKTNWKGWADRWRRYETGSDLDFMNDMGMLPTRNWQSGQFEGYAKIDKSTAPMGWPAQGQRQCGQYCPSFGCCETVVTEGPYKGAKNDIEYEAEYAFGSQCGVDSMEAIIASGQICDEFGVDLLTAGITIGFAMECFEKGLIGPKDTDGLDLRFGNHVSMVAALRKLARLEGFGLQLAKGVKRLSQEIKGSESFAMHCKGLELGGYECRGLNGQALQFAICAIGGGHHTYGIPARSETKDGTRMQVKGKGLYVKKAAIGQIIRDGMAVCSFPKGPVDDRIIGEALSAITGEEWSAQDLNEVGERVICQERLFNMREGLTRKDDALPSRLTNEPKPDGPTKGAIVPLEELKDDFYTAMGYDLSTGNPPDSLVAQLGIKK